MLPEIPYFPGIYTVILIIVMGIIASIAIGKRSRVLITGVSELVIAIAIAYLIDLPVSQSGYTIFDDFSRFISLIFLGTSFLILISLHRELSDVPRYELAASLILAANIGMIVAVSSLNIIYIVVGWELAGLSSYAVIATRRRDPVVMEAAMKFFIVGSIGFGLTLFGISFIFGATGSLDLTRINAVLSTGMYDYNLLVTGIILLISGLGFKMAIVPFHVWIPDTYEGAPYSITSFLAAASKTMAFAVGLRLFYRGLGPVSNIWQPLFAVLAIITMTYGNLAALAQTKMKRLLAWSSIAHAGYIILLFGAFGPSANLIAGGLFHILTHAIMKILAFIAAAYFAFIAGSDLITDYAGLGKKYKLASFFLAIDLFSLAGIPPLAGFVSKYLLFLGVVENGFVWLALIAVINSAISLYYYMRILKYLFFEEGKVSEVEVKVPSIYLIPIVLTGLAIIVLGIFSDPLIHFLKSISP